MLVIKGIFVGLLRGVLVVLVPGGIATSLDTWKIRGVRASMVEHRRFQVQASLADVNPHNTTVAVGLVQTGDPSGVCITIFGGVPSSLGINRITVNVKHFLAGVEARPAALGVSSWALA